jgi:hypothetical protein
MADSTTSRRVVGSYNNNLVTADVVQQGTDNAARDINHAGRDIKFESHFYAPVGKYLFTL